VRRLTGGVRERRGVQIEDELRAPAPTVRRQCLDFPARLAQIDHLSWPLTPSDLRAEDALGGERRDRGAYADREDDGPHRVATASRREHRHEDGEDAELQEKPSCISK
jgi:hypothetical protein